MAKTKKPASKRKPNWFVDESKYLNSTEVKKLRRHCEKLRDIGLKEQNHVSVRDWFMVELGLCCGIRVGEMADLRVGDLNIRQKEPSLIVRNGKGSKARIVYFGQEFKQAIGSFLRWKEANNQSTEKESIVLTDKLGNQLSRRTLQKSFKRCLEGAGISAKYSIHCLRHTYATHLYRASGYNLRLVQQQLGHSSIRTTQVYADLLQEDMQRAVKRLYK